MFSIPKIPCPACRKTDMGCYQEVNGNIVCKGIETPLPPTGVLFAVNDEDVEDFLKPENLEAILKAMKDFK